MTSIGSLKLSESKFLHRHPDVTELQEWHVLKKGFKGVQVAALRHGEWVCVGAGRTREQALYNLSIRLLALDGRKVFELQEWRDANTGEITRLSAHHIVKRSKSRNDSKKNLAGLGLRSHSAQHEKKLLGPSSGEAASTAE